MEQLEQWTRVQVLQGLDCAIIATLYYPRFLQWFGRIDEERHRNEGESLRGATNLINPARLLLCVMTSASQFEKVRFVFVSYSAWIS